MRLNPPRRVRAALYVATLVGTPVVAYWWELDPNYYGAMGAAIGFIGLSIAEAFLRAGDRLDVKELLRSWLLRGHPKG